MSSLDGKRKGHTDSSSSLVWSLFLFVRCSKAIKGFVRFRCWTPRNISLPPHERTGRSLWSSGFGGQAFDLVPEPRAFKRISGWEVILFPCFCLWVFVVVCLVFIKTKRQIWNYGCGGLFCFVWVFSDCLFFAPICHWPKTGWFYSADILQARCRYQNISCSWNHQNCSDHKNTQFKNHKNHKYFPKRYHVFLFHLHFRSTTAEVLRLFLAP